MFAGVILLSLHKEMPQDLTSLRFHFRRTHRIAKVIISFVMSVRPSEWNNSVPTGRTFMIFDILLLIEKLRAN